MLHKPCPELLPRVVPLVIWIARRIRYPITVGRRSQEQPARLEDAPHLSKELIVLLYVLEHLDADNAVDTCICER